MVLAIFFMKSFSYYKNHVFPNLYDFIYVTFSEIDSNKLHNLDKE